MSDSDAKGQSKEQIIIDLDHLGVTLNEITAETEFLHSDAFDRVMEIIARSLGDEISSTDGYVQVPKRPQSLDVIERRRHGAVMISARRGEGKTTLLVSLMKSIQDGSYKNRSKNSSKLVRLYSLSIIDPTLIESKQNFIVAVVARIRCAVHYEHENSNDYYKKDSIFDAVEMSMRELAGGLKLLDGVGSSLHESNDWDDADYIMDVGLHGASAAYDLERKLNTFVEKAARYLKIDAFVLAIDDADTLFERGWPVLEALRKYLTIPRLRIIISGDIELFTELVRRKQWEQFGKDFLEAEAKLSAAIGAKPRIRALGSMVGQLQDQYLVKLLPPENRIALKSLTVKARHGKILLQSKEFLNAGIVTRLDVATFVERFADLLLGLRSTEAVELIRNRLLELPTRSAVQILAGATALVGTNKYRADATEAAIDRLRHTASSALLDCGLYSEDTRDPISEPILPRLAEWLTYSTTWSGFSRFYPDAVDNNEGNLTQLFLGALLHQVFSNNPGRMLEYWLRIAMVRDWLDRGVFPGKENDPEKVAEELDRFLNAKSQDGTLQIVSKFAAWAMYKAEAKDMKLGIRLSSINIPYDRVRGADPAMYTLYGKYYSDGEEAFNRRAYSEQINDDSLEDLFKKTELPEILRCWHRSCFKSKWSYTRTKGTGFDGYFVNTIDGVRRRMIGAGKFALEIPLMLVLSGQSSSYGAYSFLRLISVIGDIVALTPNVGEKELENKIEKIIIYGAAIRSYPTPATSGQLPAPDGDPVSEDNIDNSTERSNRIAQDDTSSSTVSDDEKDSALQELAASLAAWLSAHHKIWMEDQRAIAPVTLSRMWTRFTYTFDNIVENLVHRESRYLGVVFHRAIIAFLHAVGVEAARASGTDLPASAWKNPVTSGGVFLSLLQNAPSETSAPEWRLFKFLFSCPLWGFFLDQNENSGEIITDKLQTNGSIFRIYQKSVNAYREDNSSWKASSLWKVVINEPGSSEKTVQFQGLFNILNTVYIQGQFVPKQKASEASQALVNRRGRSKEATTSGA